MTHQQELYEAVKAFLPKRFPGLQFRENSQGYSFTYGMNLPCKISSCQVTILVQTDSIVFVTTCPLKATSDTIGSVAEFLMRANSFSAYGHFELDYKDGEIRYINSIYSVSTIPSFEEIDYINRIGLFKFRDYGDGMVKNIMGYGNPEEDIRAIEQK